LLNNPTSRPRLAATGLLNYHHAMADRFELERRVKELEAENARLRGAGAGVGVRGMRYRSAYEIWNLPLVAIAAGADLAKGEMRGHARGVIAIGDIATGVIAVGGLARGLIAIGGLAIGGVTFGGLSIGAIAAAGGLAIGSLAFGGGAVGGVAIGGGAAGYYACGGGAAGAYTVSAMRADLEAADFFARYGLGSACGKPRVR
jgi:hypothetical protein